MAEQKERTVAMLRDSLAKRFHLQAKLKMKKMPVYVLEVAPGGAKLTSPGRVLPHKKRMPGWSEITMRRATIGQFIEMLRQAPAVQGREIIDKTGIKGRWNFNFLWPEEVPVKVMGADGPYSAKIAEGQWANPSPGLVLVAIDALFKELPPELGLELVAKKESVPVLDIERIMKPRLH